MAPDTWPEVGAAVRRRREELGLSQVELARAAETSETTIRVLETARRTSYRGPTLRLVARALDWPDDAISRLLAGRPPDEEMAERDTRTVEDRIAALERELTALKADLHRRART